MKWENAPKWANFLLELEGGTKIWSESSTDEVLLGEGDKSQKVLVKNCQPRPAYKTFIHLKDQGVLVKYEFEGEITHQQAKRLLRDAGYDVRGLRYVLEYEKVIY